MASTFKDGVKRKTYRYGRNVLYCCVAQCDESTHTSSFHQFPKNPTIRKKWIDVLKLKKAPTTYTRICGRHFRPYDFFPGQKVKPRLKLNVIPSQNIPGVPNNPDPAQNEMLRKSPLIPEHTEQIVIKPEIVEFDDMYQHKLAEPVTPQKNVVQVKQEMSPIEDCPTKTPKIEVTDDITSLYGLPTLEEMGPKKPPTRDNEAEINTLPIHLIIRTKEVFCSYTGLHSFELLNRIVRCVADIEKKSQTNAKVLSLKDRVILVFVTLKMNLDFGVVAPMFNISSSTCTRYFRTLVHLLATVLESAIPMPSQDNIRCNIPITFKNYTTSKVLIDCSKGLVEKSKCPKCRILTYSHNKKYHTVKFKLGISPSGLITSITRCYQGKATDKFITLKTHNHEKMDLQNPEMEDKGFFIGNECLERNVISHQPPFLEQKEAEAIKTKSAKSGKIRMQAERIIDKLRDFELLKSTVSWYLLPFIDDCLVVACGIVNLSNPILSMKNFV